MIATFIGIILSATPADIAAQSAQAHDRLLRFNATVIGRHATKDKQHRQVVWDIQVARPDRVRIGQQIITGQQPYNRSIIVNGNRLLIVDDQLRQYTQQTVKGKTLADKLKGVGTPLDELVLAVIDEGGIKKFLDSARKRFKLKTERNAMRSEKFTIAFDGRTSHVQSILQYAGTDIYSWSLGISGSPPDSAFIPPATYAKVKSFKESPAPAPSDAKAKQELAKVLNFYDRDRSLSFSTSGTLGSTKAWVSGKGQAREAAGNWEWSFGSGNLTVRSSSRKQYFSGKAKATQIQSKLAKIGGVRTPMLTDLVQGKNPIRRWIGADFKVSHSGTMKVSGTQVGILRSQSKDLRISLQYRTKDGAVTQVTVESIEGSGRTRLTSQTNFSYKDIGKALPASQFRLPKPVGYTSLPLNRL